MAAMVLLVCACSEARPRLVLRYPDEAAFERADFVRIYVGEGFECGELRQLESRVRLTYDPHATAPELGAVEPGITSFLAVIQDAECQVFLDGCVEAEVGTGKYDTVNLFLRRVEGAGCAAAERCVDDQCVEIDAGAVDASLLDTAVLDTAGLDTSLADAVVPDAAVPDAAVPDAATPDAVAGDAAEADGSPGPLLWVQSSELDFSAGIPDHVDLATSPGEVRLSSTPFLINAQIAADERDAWEDGASARLDRCFFGDEGFDDTAGMQWPLDIPRGAIVDSAVLSVYSSRHGGVFESYVAAVRVEDVDDPVVFSGLVGDIQGRTYWETTVPWSIPPEGLATGTWSHSPAITELVQHTVDRAGWTPGNHLGLAVWGETNAGGCLESLHDFSQDPTLAAKLEVEFSAYAASGTIASQVLDTTVAGATWFELAWDVARPGGTEVSFEVRASDSYFTLDELAPAWVPVGAVTPVTGDLPVGRYLQWRATLASTSAGASPVLSEVRVWYY